MQVEQLQVNGSWNEVKEGARSTIGRMGVGKEPTNTWKKQILLAEHSPIRRLVYSWMWKEIPYFTSVHLVRHNVGITHFVSTQRTDRTGEDRNSKPQDAPVNHLAEANAQALISISRKRLCNQASKETREAWQAVKDAIKEVDPVMSSCMVRECTYRGFCPEFTCCGYVHTEAYKKELEEYRCTES